jgi:hypothetical protein
MDSCDFSQAIWRKSRHSATTHCVEVAQTPTVVGVRDSKDPNGLVLQYPSTRWAAFLGGIKAGEFDHPDDHQ